MAHSAALPHVEAGTMKVLGITSAEPSPLAPDLPVMAKRAGLPGDFRAELSNAFIAPAGTDPAIIERLNTDINAILEVPAMTGQMLAMGWKTQPGTPDELAERLAADIGLWGAVIDRIEAQ